ncbi:hypothetical protein FRC06_006095 [Ceratobasidium sp. 370]|nr:hypothetical protein FRC06_006095 [Ceratobasidium sp. 370]
MSQLVLASVGALAPSSPKFYAQTLLIPAACATLSAVILVLHVIFTTASARRYIAKLRGRPIALDEEDIEDVPTVRQHTGFFPDLRSHIQGHGGGIIFMWKMLRLLACLALTALTILAIISINEGHKTVGATGPDWNVDPLGKKHKKHHKREHWFSRAEWMEISMCMFYTYATLLAIFALTLGPRPRTVANIHLIILLLAAFGVFTWRDLLPFATFSLHPADSAGGWLTWTRIGILGFAAVVVPLCIPRPYVPLNPRSPGIPNPEQTAPLISLILYTFMDPLVWVAYRAPKLEYEQLPPLADYDHAAHLRQRSFTQLDPFESPKQRHLFWSLMYVFRKEYRIMAIVMTIRALMEFASPLGIRFLLKYLENPSSPGFFRPWVWILLLFLGPVVGSIAIERYNFINTRALTQGEGMLTQLLFEHSLRIRMIAETTTSPNPTQESSEIGTPRGELGSPGREEQDADGAAAAHAAETSDAETLVASTSAIPTSKDNAQETEGEDQSDSSNLVGKINNLMSTVGVFLSGYLAGGKLNERSSPQDLKNITEGVDFLYVILYAPIQIIVSVIFLYQILGWSAIIGMAVMVLFAPVPTVLADLVNSIQSERMKKTDARVQTITESINVVRMIKMFAWEDKVKSQVTAKREEELRWYRKRQYLGLANIQVNFVLPVIVMIVTYASHTLVFGHTLDASTVFSSISVFQVMRNQLHWLFWQIPRVIQGKVSLDRFNEFLIKTELLDAYTARDPASAIEPSLPSLSVIGFRNAEFTWTQHILGAPAPSRRNFRLRIEDEVTFHWKEINMIIGPTGCGKTSLLMALLGEMHFISSGRDSWFSLPRDGGVAYVAQEAWVQNDTIRNNILFGSEYDERRYNTVITQCALERDLALFDAGDQTEVGEKGVTLSGGQRARISLARAIYSRAEILLLDDILSALDVHTARWIVDKCFKGELMAGRTTLIVTHNVAMVSEVAEFVLQLGPNGRVTSQGSVAEVLQPDLELHTDSGRDTQDEKQGERALGDKEPTKPADGKLVVAEEVAEGHVGWPAMKLFLLAFGGPAFWMVYTIGFVVADVISLLQTYWLGIWARAYEANSGHTELVNVPFYVATYAGIGIGFMIVYSLTFVVHIFGAVRASQRVHDRLVASVLGAPLRWLDSTPVGRITARFTQDIRAVDDSLPTELQNFVYMSVQLIGRFAAVVIFSPIFTIPGAFVLVVGITIGQIYISAQLSVKREMSNARSPLFSHFGAAIAGITSIRAYGVQGQFKDETLKRIDRYTRAARTFYNLNRWVCIRMDTLGGAFAAGLAAYMVYGRPSVDASDTGFSLSMAVAFSGNVLWWTVMLNNLEVTGNSLERIQAYVQIEQEPAPVPEKRPPAYWPASGRIVVENLTARYAVDRPAVLRGLSFEIESGERVGVVGRTGSGKSSLTLALLRMLPIEGTVYYDGIPTHELNLDSLRSNITIIPQHPELMSGTIRQNLDPFEEHDDAALYAALRSAGLDTLQAEDEQGNNISLDTGVSAGGANFSLGQRQIIALARAIVRGSKVLILDEATAAIDYTTDAVIQTSLRTELADKTLIIVAHRLQTVCDADKIMVLEAGRIVEFDTPLALLQNERGAFRALVDESGDRDALYAAVGATSRV